MTSKDIKLKLCIDKNELDVNVYEIKQTITLYKYKTSR